MPRRMLPLVSHGEYADGTDRRTDGRTPDRYITLSAMDAAIVIISWYMKLKDSSVSKLTCRTAFFADFVRVNDAFNSLVIKQRK